MTTTDQPTALAVREFSDKQILTRIKAASEPGFGLAGATAAQQNMIYLLARHYDVDPAVDITLFRDRPWFTIDGRVRLMKRHPQYRGYETRPVVGPEKEAWGYKADDLVIECAIRTESWGTLKARGKVSAAEMKSNAPTGSHPSEMAEKRAIARASRLAFGQDVPDEDEVGYLVEERADPVRNAALAARHDEIFASEYDAQDRGWTPQQGVESVRQDPEQTAPARQEQIADPVDQQTIGSKKDPVWVAWLKACHRATEAGFEFDRDAVQLGMTVAQIGAATKSLLAEVADAAETTQASAF